MTQENEDQKAVHETTEDEDSPVNLHEAELFAYKDLMLKCFGVAHEVLQQVDGINIGAGPDIALTLFNRCTREMPEQVKIASLGLEYITTLMEEKETEKDSFVPMAPFVSPMLPCKHPQLRALRNVLLSSDGNSFSLIGDSVLAALAVKVFSEVDYQGSLCCPVCRGLVPVETFKNGTLFSESEEDEQISNEC